MPADSRTEIRQLFAALELQARQAVELGDKAKRDIGEDRFGSYLDFRRKVEEVRALAALTEQKLEGSVDERLDDLRAEFERLDLFLISQLIQSTHAYFSLLRDDQPLPLGARDLFAPELRIVEELRGRMTGPDRQGLSTTLVSNLDETATMIRRLLDRAPALEDFSDTPSPPRPLRRLRSLGSRKK